MSNVLTGSDVRAYTFAGNGWDEFPNLSSAFSVLGIYKNIEVTFKIERDDVTPSSQLLKERKVVSVDWTASIENQVRSGGPPGMNLLANGQWLVQVIFQEEVGGGWWTLYGGISEDSYKIPRGERMENITLENCGPVGTSGGSIFYAAAGAVQPGQAAQYTASAYDRAVTAGYFAR